MSLNRQILLPIFGLLIFAYLSINVRFVEQWINKFTAQEFNENGALSGPKLNKNVQFYVKVSDLKGIFPFVFL